MGREIIARIVPKLAMTSASIRMHNHMHIDKFVVAHHFSLSLFFSFPYSFSSQPIDRSNTQSFPISFCDIFFFTSSHSHFVPYKTLVNEMEI